MFSCMKIASGARTYSLSRSCWMSSSKSFEGPNNAWFDALHIRGKSNIPLTREVRLFWIGFGRLTHG